MDCNGCERLADWPTYTSNADKNAQNLSRQFETYVTDYIFQALITPCFKFDGKDRLQQFLNDKKLSKGISTGLDKIEDSLPDQYFSSRDKPPEYIVGINYYENLHQDWMRQDGHKVLKEANLTVSLYYNGTSGRELVDSWNESTRVYKTDEDYSGFKPENLPDSWFGVSRTVRNLCNSDNFPLNSRRPIDIYVLKDFEKQPADCEVKLEKGVCPGEEVEVNVREIRDSEGRLSREFNRLVISALEGEIIGGVELENYPKYYAFLVGNETITFRYQAPTDPGITKDRITVLNSCDITRVDQYPLQKTTPKDVIEEKNIEIEACYDAMARVTVTESVTEKGEKTVNIGSGSNLDSRDYKYDITASVDLKLSQTRTLPIPRYNEYYEYYKIVGVDLVNFQAKLKDVEYSYSENKEGSHEQTETWEGSGMNARLGRTSVMMLKMQEVYAVYDSETKKAKAVFLPGPGVEYTFRKTFNQVGHTESPSGPRD